MSDRLLRNLLLASTAIVSAPAMADPFLVNETVIPGTQTLGNADLSADQITFNYVARVNQSSPIIGGTGAFTESGFFLKNTFVLNNTPVASPNYSLLNFPEAGIGTGGVGAGAGYRLYGIFNIGGTATPSGTDIVANFQTMSLTLYVDPKQDDSFDFGPPASPVNGLNLTATATDPSGDDQALLTETLVEGRANIRAR